MRAACLVSLVAFALVVAAAPLAGCGGGGATAGVAPLGLPSQAPEIVLLEGADTSLRVVWTAVEGAEAYALYMAAAPGPSPASYQQLPEGQLFTGLTGTELNVGSLTQGTTYWCCLAARNSQGEGPLGIAASTMLRSVAVGALTVRPGNARAVVQWVGPRGASAFDLYLAEDPSVSVDTWAGLPGGRRLSNVSPPLEITGLTNDVPVFVTIVATNVSGDSPGSPLGSCTPTARGAFFLGTPSPVGAGPQGVVTADLDLDGILDLAVADTDGGSVSVLRGLGDATFVSVGTYTVGAGPVAVAAADLDGNGYPDLASADSLDGTVSVLLSDGMGGFLSAQSYPVGATPRFLLAVELATFSGVLDLVVANRGDDTVSVLSGVGDGTFGTTLPYSTGAGPVHLLAGDFDQDGDTDVVSADQGAGTVSFLASDGSGALAAPVASAAGQAPASLSLAELNADAYPDLLITDQGGGNLLSLTGMGDGTFSLLTTVVACPSPIETISADFDHDGVLDLAIVHSGLGSIRVFLGDALGTYTELADFSTGATISALVVGDFNADGVLDLAASEPSTGTMLILLGVSP